jgi:hypothetical protein
MRRPNWLREEDTGNPSERTEKKNKSNIKREEKAEFGLKNKAKHEKASIIPPNVSKRANPHPFAPRKCVSLQDFPPEQDVDVAAERAAEF